MRTISAAAVAKLAERVGIEPITVIEVTWATDNVVRYGDRAIPEESIEGRILEMGEIENVTDVSKSTSSSSVSIKLDDTDKKLKGILDYKDIHKKKVQVYQWFTGISYSDKILLFTGEISSPIVWSEAERTLSFEVLSTFQTREVGISLEAGKYTNIPADLVGKVIPIIYGSVIKLPGILIDEIKNGDEENSGENVLEEPFGIEDPTLEHEINRGDFTHTTLMQLATIYILGYLQASFTARKTGELGELDDIKDGKGQYSSLALQYLDQANRYLEEAHNVLLYKTDLDSILKKQKEYNKKNLRITNGDRYKVGQPLKVNLNGANIEGYFSDANNFAVVTAVHPHAQQTDGLDTTLEDYYEDPRVEPIYTRNNLHYVDAGTRFFINSQTDGQGNEQEDPNNDLAIRYVIAYGTVTVFGAYAKRTNKQGQSILTPIPPKYYTIKVKFFGGLPMTICRMPKPLSMRVDQFGESEGWDDDVYFSCTGNSGNIATIITNVVLGYTNLTVDAASFAEASPYLTRANFALQQRKDAFQFIQELAYQARCAVWIKDNKVYIKYLGKIDTVVATITEADIIFGSMELMTTETEDIVTKYVAEWRANYKRKDPHKIIIRYNIPKYGLHEETYDYYAFNQAASVFNAATFWVVRTAHTFKRLRFRTSLARIALETFDTVNLAFTNRIVANGTVIGVIEEANIDTSNFEMQFTVWVPVLLGEMEQFTFTFPTNIPVGGIFPRQQDRPNAGDPGPSSGGAQPTDPEVSEPFTGSQENGGIHFVPPQRADTARSDWPDFNGGNFTPPSDPIGTAISTTNIVPVGPPPKDVTKYQYKRFDLNPKLENVFENKASMYPGRILSGEMGIYTVEIFPEGLDGTALEVENVEAMDVNDENSPLPEGMPIFVMKLMVPDPDADKSSGVSQTEKDSGSTIKQSDKLKVNKLKAVYYIIPPVWMGTDA